MKQNPPTRYTCDLAKERMILPATPEQGDVEFTEECEIISEPLRIERRKATFLKTEI